MRHLELPTIKLDDSDIKNECNIEIKDEDLQDLDIKDELIGFCDIDEALTIVGLQNLQTYDKKDLVTEETSQSNQEDDTRLCTNPNSLAITNINLDLDKNYQSTDDNEVKTKNQTTPEVDNWKINWGFKCMQCDETWTSKAAFDKHYRTAYGLTPVYMCAYCNKTTDKYSTFRSHCYRHAMEGRFPCLVCGKSFSMRSSLITHQQLKHFNIASFPCDQCEHSFKTRNSLKLHQQRNHNESQNVYPCGECGKVLRTKGGLTSHLAVHRLGRRFMCDLCGKTFTQKVNLQLHVKQHAGVRPWICSTCGKSFAERSHLSRHNQFHTNIRSFHCDICNRFYKTERCLKVHKLVHSEHRPHSCEYCGKGFLSSTKLKQHINIHTGERPYKCQLCERSFTNYPNWLKHIRRRHPAEADKLRSKRKGNEQNVEVQLPPFELEFEAPLQIVTG